jgi:hypothetical protein
MYKYVRVHQWHNVHIEFPQNRSPNLKSEKEIHVSVCTHAHTVQSRTSVPFFKNGSFVKNTLVYIHIITAVNTGKLFILQSYMRKPCVAILASIYACY